MVVEEGNYTPQEHELEWEEQEQGQGQGQEQEQEQEQPIWERSTNWKSPTTICLHEAKED